MPKKKFGIVLPIVLVSYFMILLDNSIVFTSTVKISHDLHMSAQALSWISDAYILTFGGLLLFSGRLGDLYGRKRIFEIGLGIFTLASLLVGLSVNAPMMFATRALQGIGSSIIAPTTLALLIDNYQGEMLQRGINYYGVTAGLGASFGLLIGGLIASFTSWRVGFLINVPIGLVLLILTQRYLRDQVEPQFIKLDWSGAILSVLGLSGIIYGINGGPGRIVALVMGIVLLGGFVLQERQRVQPIMPLGLFSDRTRVLAYLARFCFMGVSFTYLYLAPQLLQNLYQYTPLQAAFAFLLMTIPQFFVASSVSALNQRFSNGQIAFGATLFMVLAFAWILIVNLTAGFWLSLAIPMVLIGIGNGLAMAPLTALGVQNTTGAEAGAASGVVNTFHQIGQSTGLAITIALVGSIADPAVSFNRAVMILMMITFIAVIALGWLQIGQKQEVSDEG